jgi:hypothetical protein
MGLGLVAAFAFVALAASSASAAGPEWGRCVAQSKGHYEDGNCTKEKFKESKGKKTYSGKYEWKAGAPATVECEAKKKGNYLTSACDTEKESKGKVEEHKGKFEKYGPNFTAAAGEGVLKASIYECRNSEGRVQVPRKNPECEEFENNIEEIGVECTSEHATGEATGTDEVANVSVRFKGCQLFGIPAETHGLASGEIQVSTLKGKLGYINKSATPEPEVGVLLEPAAGGLFAEFELEEVPLTTRVGVGNATAGAFYEPEATGGYDGVISPITPINQMTHTFTQSYKAQVTKGVIPTCCGLGNKVENVPSHFEGGHIELLETYLENTEENFKEMWSPAAQELTNTNTVEGEAEIKG